MKVILVCTKVERLAARKYRAFFKQYPHGTDIIEADLDCPAVPGGQYNVLLRGVFPGYAGNQPCVGDVLSFTCRETLTACNAEQELQLHDEKLQSGEQH